MSTEHNPSTTSYPFSLMAPGCGLLRFRLVRLPFRFASGASRAVSPLAPFLQASPTALLLLASPLAPSSSPLLAALAAPARAESRQQRSASVGAGSAQSLSGGKSNEIIGGRICCKIAIGGQNKCCAGFVLTSGSNFAANAPPGNAMGLAALDPSARTAPKQLALRSN